MYIEVQIKLTDTLQRPGVLRIASSYRTVSRTAVLVVAGVLPTNSTESERKYTNATLTGEIER